MFVVSGAVQRGEQLSYKLLSNGGFRESSNIQKLLSRGSAGLKAKAQKKKEFGAEGEEGEEAHARAMKNVMKEFGI